MKSDSANNGVRKVVNVNKLSNDFVSMCLVPVYVKFQQNNIMTYALLDNCSQGTFIDEELLSYLGSNFDETDLSVTTLIGHEVSRSKVFNGLQVREINANSP